VPPEDKDSISGWLDIQGGINNLTLSNIFDLFDFIEELN
jgi:hypothetical protein